MPCATRIIMISHLEAQIRQQLQQIHPVTLQKLAEDLASIKFPDRFGGSVLRRPGRNDEDQTTKGWPDAFVSTGVNEVDGIEATRQARTWKAHLEEDLKHAVDPDYRNLSGYVFVGGYPGKAPTACQIDDWVDRFVAAGASRSKVTILVGSDLVSELCRPEYAAVRQAHLGLAAESEWFRLLGYSPISDRRLGLFQPTQDEYNKELVRVPGITNAVIGDILSGGCALVQGYGAAGKTTLAELVARQNQVAPNATWYTDLVQTNDETLGAAFLNEMTELAARGTLFVVDNVHIDPDYARRIHDHWSKNLARLGARLLLLGRRTHRRGSWSSLPVPCHELRAGAAEMLSVANRLAAREGDNLTALSPQVLDAWARTFGGSEHPGETAVDLIAFTAAVDRRLKQIVAGDFRLSAADAVDAIRARYLQPIQRTRELSNILRLSALAEFEIPLMDEQLPDPMAGLTESIDSLGLVVQDDLGLDARRHYRLIHAGVGPLLLEAVGSSFSERDERLNAAFQSPGLGRRISAALRRTESSGDARREVDEAVLRSLSLVSWPTQVCTFYELGQLARHAVHEHLAPPEAVDDAIVSSNVISRLVSRSPSVPALNQFFAYAVRVGLPRAAAAVGAAIANPVFIDALGCSRPSDSARLIRAAPNGREILSRIDVKSWNDVQSRSPAEPVSETVSACRFFESLGRTELARGPALRQIMLADPKLWDRSALSFLSHILRFARADAEAVERLLNSLASSGWISISVRDGTIGHLSGALLSLANYLDPALRTRILISELELRVAKELSLFGRTKHVSRPICLFGGYHALGGQISFTQQLDWSVDPNAEKILNEVAHSETTNAIGMYEMQLWLGLKGLHQLGRAPIAVPAARGESFLLRLNAAIPPTSEGGTIKGALLQWLRQVQKTRWTLIRNAMSQS